MPFSRDGFSPDGRAVGPRIHSYTTIDAKATVDTTGYFNDIAGIVEPGDLIYVVDALTPTFTLMPVLSNTGSVVDVGDGLVIGVTDTD